MTLLNKVPKSLIKTSSIRNSTTAAAATQAIQIQEELPQSFRTNESDPSKHSIRHLSRFYTIPKEDQQFIFTQGVNHELRKQFKTFTEACLLVRQPALELITCFAQTDFTKPVNKYVIYGEDGCGKSSTLLHALHYGYATGKILVHVQWAQNWFRFPKEVVSSDTKEGFMDLPIDAASWLVNFKIQNLHLLNKADIKLSKTYEWSSTEVTSQGSPLIDLIDLGTKRIKYASDIVGVVLSELKRASIEGKCQLFVVIDGYNAFLSNHTEIKNDNKKKVPASQVSLTPPFLDITKSDWCNGIIVLTVDQTAVKDNRESYLPRYLLSKEGFEHLDPFLPVSVENYSDDEFETVIEYYKNRKWIRDITSNGITELKLLSGKNPLQLMQYCKKL